MAPDGSIPPGRLAGGAGRTKVDRIRYSRSKQPLMIAAAIRWGAVACGQSWGTFHLRIGVFLPERDGKFLSTIGIAIENVIRIDRTLIFIFQPDRD